MKYILSIWLSLMVFGIAYGQQPDTIEFKNGNIVNTTIDSVSTINELIYYQYNDAQRVASFVVLERYYFEGRWYSIGTATNPKVHYGFKGGYVDLTTVDWRVYTNLSGLLNRNDLYFSGFQASKLISIEPEYIRGNWAFKFPLQIGIDYQNKLKRSPYTRTNPGSYFDDIPFSYRPSTTYFDAPPTETSLPTYFEQMDYYSYWATQGHYTNTRFQLGVYPKYYFQGRRKRAYYLTGGFNWGIGDFGAVSYYETLDYEDQTGRFYDDNSVLRDGYRRTWTIVDQVLEVEENTFEYFRAELLLGLEFNFLNAWSLNFEYGYTTLLNNKGALEDVVYARNQNQEFERVLSYTYRPETWGGYVPVGNILIGYNIQKK